MHLASSLLLVIGILFMLLGAVGLVRMPDCYTRIQASAKTSSLGVLCVFAAVALHFADLGLAARALAVVAFAFTTVPVGAHALGRAAHRAGVPMWEHTRVDQLAEDEGAAAAPRDEG